DKRGIQILRGYDRAIPCTAVQGRPRTASEDRGHTPVNVTNVSRASAEVFVVEGGQNVCLLVRCRLDRSDRGQTFVCNRGQGQIHQRRITSKQCLRFEDGGDVSPGARSRSFHDLTQLVGSELQCASQPVLLLRTL